MKFFLSIIIFFSIPEFVISQNITGNIEGRITDAKGSSIPGVNISLSSISLQGNRGTATNNDGYFQIISLPVGEYTIKMSAVGFSRLNIENVQVQRDWRQSDLPESHPDARWDCL